MPNDDTSTPGTPDSNAQAPTDPGTQGPHDTRLTHSAIEKARLEERAKHREKIDSLQRKVDDLVGKLEEAKNRQTSTNDPDLSPEVENRLIQKFEQHFAELSSQLEIAKRDAENARREVAEFQGRLRREQMVNEEMARTGGQLIPEMITATDEAGIAQQLAASHAAWKRHFGRYAPSTPEGTPPAASDSSGPAPRTTKPAPPPAVAPADTNAPVVDATSPSSLKNVKYMSDEEYAKHRPKLQALAKEWYRKGNNPVLRP